jgi:hypothetical protein
VKTASNDGLGDTAGLETLVHEVLNRFEAIAQSTLTNALEPSPSDFSSHW